MEPVTLRHPFALITAAVCFLLLLGLLPPPAACSLLFSYQLQGSNQASPAPQPRQLRSDDTSEPSLQRPHICGYHLPADKYPEAVAYSRARYRLYFIDTAYGVLALLLLLRWRWGTKFRDWAMGRGTGSAILQAFIFAPLLIVTLAVLGLPLGIYSHWLERAYHQSVQGWKSWMVDWTKEQVIGIVFGTLLVWLLYLVIRRSPRRWWFYFWLIALPIVVFVVFIQPLVVDPLFFKFQPLQSTQPGLTREIGKVVQRAGMYVPSDRMFEMTASTKLKSVNAYVTGIGASKRVVVWDTTISRMTIAETLSVFGHEMGHYVLGHIWKAITFTAVVLLVFLYAGFRLLRWSLQRWGVSWGIRGADDWASLPVLLLILSIFTFVGSPAFNAFSRYQEHEADVYGLEVIHGLVPDSQQVTAQAFQVLGEIDLADPHPNPFIRFWLYSHPPLDERIDFALNYDPWEKGGSPRFVR